MVQSWQSTEQQPQSPTPEAEATVESDGLSNQLLQEDLVRRLGGQCPVDGTEPGPDASWMVPAVDEAAPTAEDAPYLSQIGNPTVGEVGDGARKKDREQCSPTSLTMSLLSLYDNDQERFFNALEVLLAEVGQAVDRDKDPELGVMALMLATDWDRAFVQKPEYFEHNPAWRAQHQGNEVIQCPLAQAYTASCFDAVADSGLTIASTATTVDGGASSAPMDFDGRWDWARKAFEDGGEVSFQGGFTRAGHVVQVEDIQPDAMVLQDPYGLFVEPGVYIVNGQAAPPLTGKRAAAFEARTEQNPGLRDIAAAGETSDRWGERNAYGKAELQALDALKWVLVLEAADGSQGDG